MGHLVLRHFAKQHPHTQRLRKRQDRKLRPVRPSHQAELWYRERLNGIVRVCRAAGKEIAADLKTGWPEKTEIADGCLFARDAAGPSRLGPIMSKARAKFAGVRRVALGVATDLTDRTLGAVDDRLAYSIDQSVGVNIRAALIADGPIAAEVDRSRAANVDLITSIPDQYLGKIEDAIEEHWLDGAGFESLAERIAELGEVTESRAALIARDQIGKMNSAFNRVRQTSLGIEKYEWQTAGDERVRDSHADLDGQTFRWDDPPVVDGEPANPGEPIDCRCVASPVMDLDDDELEANAAALEEPDEEEAQAA